MIIDKNRFCQNTKQNISRKYYTPINENTLNIEAFFIPIKVSKSVLCPNHAALVRSEIWSSHGADMKIAACVILHDVYN